MAPESTTPETSSSSVRDHREPPRGVLPRHVQMWVMAGLAMVIVLILLIAGRPEPPARSAGPGRAATPTLPDGDRIRAYQQQLAEDEARLQQVQAAAVAATQPPAAN